LVMRIGAEAGDGSKPCRVRTHLSPRCRRRESDQLGSWWQDNAWLVRFVIGGAPAPPPMTMSIEASLIESRKAVRGSPPTWTSTPVHGRNALAVRQKMAFCDDAGSAARPAQLMLQGHQWEQRKTISVLEISPPLVNEGIGIISAKASSVLDNPRRDRKAHRFDSGGTLGRLHIDSIS